MRLDELEIDEGFSRGALPQELGRLELQALQEQLRQMEEAIREEQLSDEEREWRRQWRKRQAEIKREARRRLGLPEEETPC